jgi:serine/threonine protein kinase
MIYSGIENSTGELFILKFIHIGGRDAETKKKTVKELNSEFHVKMNISRNSENLVHYKEIFEYKSFSVIVMEYCDYGDLQTILDNGKKFIEEVYLYIIFIILFSNRKSFILQQIF